MLVGIKSAIVDIAGEIEKGVVNAADSETVRPF